MARRPRLVAEDAEQGGTDDEKIVREAKKRFTRCVEWEASARKKFIDDVKFVNADSENLWQWPDSVRQSRGIGSRDEKPCLTINKTRQHCLQIINDARQNKTSVKFHPVGNEASYEAAQMMEGIMRHIEYISDAQSAYTTGSRWQIEGGIGYWRVVLNYVDDESFDQDIYIRRVKDPMTVYPDPDFQETDGSDMRYCFVYDDLPKDLFEDMYPQFKGRVPPQPLGGVAMSDDWLNQDHVRIAEYFRCVKNEDRIFVLTDPTTGKTTKVRQSELPKELRDTAIDQPGVKHRKIVENKVEWYLIAGNEIVERREWPGKYIPIIRVPGEETVIEGQLDRKGHVRALKDPQRMYNYHVSSEVEFVALQSKTPYIAPAQAIEGLETYWETANLVNHSVLPYNHKDDDGNPIPPPIRLPPPVASDAYIRGAEIAANDMMLVSGQYQADFGAPSNERSGVAIDKRQRQGDNATYHYIDHLSMAIRFTGKIVLDLIPKVYDTKRIVKIMAEDGQKSDLMIDPQAMVAYQKTQAQNQYTASRIILNPNIGKYDVESDVGPGFATRREEAFNALSQIATQSPQLMSVIGDLVLKAADFPMADEAAARLRRGVPPQLLSDGPSPDAVAAQAKLAAMQQLAESLAQQLTDKGAEERHKDDEASIRSYEAITKRFDMLLERLGPQELGPDRAAELEAETSAAAQQSQIEMQQAEHAASLDMATAQHATGLDMASAQHQADQDIRVAKAQPRPAAGGA